MRIDYQKMSSGSWKPIVTYEPADQTWNHFARIYTQRISDALCTLRWSYMYDCLSVMDEANNAMKDISAGMKEFRSELKGIRKRVLSDVSNFFIFRNAGEPRDSDYMNAFNRLGVMGDAVNFFERCENLNSIIVNLEKKSDFFPGFTIDLASKEILQGVKKKPTYR
ncbi:hypothetical protein JXB11_02525 [Candidatus Woesearchaeota archaeon]|nr:hypothetical protein [Candidatus Woesearchaeota archaeon]